MLWMPQNKFTFTSNVPQMNQPLNVIMFVVHMYKCFCLSFWTENAEATATDSEPKKEEAPGESCCNAT